jgi:hypothetical protein
MQDVGRFLLDPVVLAYIIMHVILFLSPGRIGDWFRGIFETVTGVFLLVLAEMFFVLILYRLFKVAMLARFAISTVAGVALLVTILVDYLPERHPEATADFMKVTAQLPKDLSPILNGPTRTVAEARRALGGAALNERIANLPFLAECGTYEGPDECQGEIETWPDDERSEDAEYGMDLEERPAIYRPQFSCFGSLGVPGDVTVWRGHAREQVFPFSRDSNEELYVVHSFSAKETRKLRFYFMRGINIC